VDEGQRPLELILARNLMTGLSTPAFLVDEDATLVFYNEAAGALLGRRFEEAGRMPVDEWRSTFGPFDSTGALAQVEDLPLMTALRRNRPAHSRFRVRAFDGTMHDIQVSAIPIVTTEGTRGAMAIFWPDVEKEG
jgi:PAS domain-containing protein